MEDRDDTEQSRFASTFADPLRHWADRIGFAAVSILVVGVGFVQGSIVVTIPLWGLLGADSIVVLNATIACLLFAGTLLLSGVVMVADVVRDGTPRTTATDGPTVAAIVPVYGDAAILHRSVESLLASTYETVAVYIACEPGDTATIERAETFAERDRVHCLINTENPGTKAAAVDYAAAVTESEYLGVFDADERVHPEFVAAAVADLRSHDGDIFQGRTLPRPDGPLEAVAYYESILLGYLTHRLLGVLTNFRMATSNVIVVRRTAFERVGGYDPAMLTEDFDFAFRCYEAGLDVRESLAYPSEIEAAHTLTDWWGQRKRWMTGYAQVFHRRLSVLRPTVRSVLSLVVCGGAIAGNLFLLSLVPQVVVLAAAGTLDVLAVVLLTLWALALVMRWFDFRAGHVDSIGVAWLAVPLVLPFYSLAALKGIVEYPLSWRGEWYRVTKGV